MNHNKKIIYSRIFFDYILGFEYNMYNLHTMYFN